MLTVIRNHADQCRVADLSGKLKVKPAVKAKNFEILKLGNFGIYFSISQFPNSKIHNLQSGILQIR